MSRCEKDFSREKAVRLSAELLRNAGIAFFPIDIRRLLTQSFAKQIVLIPYNSDEKKEKSGSEETAPDPRLLSKDGFCVRIQDALVDYETASMIGNIWNIYYNETSLQERIRFTLMHELGHVFLGHHQILGIDSTAGMENMPEYREADAQADQFSINALAPAPAVARLLKEHGFSYDKRTNTWTVTDPSAPFLRNLGQNPDPMSLVMTAFGISQAAADRRLKELQSELKLWETMDPDLYHWIEQMGHRSGWFCWVCHTRRRSSSPYCPGCGKGWSYEYKDFGRFSRPVIRLRKNGQFDFCSVCGNTEYSDDASYCPVCGSPIINECLNAQYTDGDFIRSGMYVIRGTHRCKPTDIFCGTCGVLTTFGERHGPHHNDWLPGKGGNRCRIQSAVYPATYQTVKGRLTACPACGSRRTMRDGRYCADCMQPLENSCTGGKDGSHACAPNDRYCSICGHPTLFFQSKLLPEYTGTDTYAQLLRAETGVRHEPCRRLFIQPDGTTYLLDQEDC